MPASRVSNLANELRGSAILRIAGEVRQLAKEGKRIADLTVGDFSSSQFRIPRELEDGIIDALRQGETTYPPSIGLESLRSAVVQFYRERLAVDISLPSVLIASGARPAIYATYRALVDRGDRVIFGVPSWNNDYYCEIVGAKAVMVDCDASTNFQPTADALRPFVRDARMIALNSPLNPTGTLFDAATLAGICDLVLEENARRGTNERPLYVMYDQVYWMLTFGGARHVDPLSLRPDIAPYLVIVDAISKAFASTGLRVGWAIAAPDVIRPMNDIIGHVGAWAPRAEQVATARFLGETAAVDAYLEVMHRDATRRLDAVYDGLTGLRDDGLPVDCVRPQGAIYVSARFPLHGMQTRDGRTLRSDDEIREFLLHEAGLAAVPFSAFGAVGDRGWFRLSIGAVSVETIETVIPVLRRALSELRDPADRTTEERIAASHPRAIDQPLGAD
ncbi:MAG TPA: aminotransferase class I/II-fold pyridoxal phosphate-dependent enzyme [Gemmatimonadaceae bacterium]|jgi:aspartate aminotransferase|nr:aminotransferase class I/II-fold pyridoxal phosphate-dependent enzyme [Gemmatimonadaceae bacterium]